MWRSYVFTTTINVESIAFSRFLEGISAIIKPRDGQTDFDYRFCFFFIAEFERFLILEGPRSARGFCIIFF